jgi:hypothetical protein
MCGRLVKNQQFNKLNNDILPHDPTVAWSYNIVIEIAQESSK